MKSGGKTRFTPARALWFAALAVALSARAAAQESAENPYQSIVDRNVFALKPPPDPETLKPPTPPPPPIELQGISVLFGRKRVLFTVTVPGSKPGQPPERKALILAEGERRDEVEVLEIDEKTGTVKFNNHGQEDIRTLAKDSSKIAAAPPPPAAPPAPGAIPSPQPAPPTATFNPPPGAGHAGATLRNIPTRPVRVTPGTPETPQPPQPAPPPK